MSDSKQKLTHKKVAILATNGFEQSELFKPKEALEDAGAEVTIVSLKSGKIKAWNKDDWGKSIDVDTTVADTSAAEFDALMLPGGVMNPDALRNDEKAVQFVKDFAADGKPIAAICHGPWTLVEAGLVEGKTLTSYASIKTDIINAGGQWVDEEVQIDGNLVTSRKPDDLPAFNEAMVKTFAAGRQAPAASKNAKTTEHRTLQ